MQPAHNPPRYFVFEGADGGGKTTLSAKFFSALASTSDGGPGIPLTKRHHFAFPSTITAPGRLIRKQFAGEETIGEKAMGYLMLADAIDMEPLLWQHYTAGNYIVCDRHTLISGWVYQTEVFNLDALLGMQRRDQFLTPERVFIIDVPGDVAEERMAKRAVERNKMYEKPDPKYRERLRQRYLAYAMMHPQHTTVIDGRQPIEESLQQCLQYLGTNGKV